MVAAVIGARAETAEGMTREPVRGRGKGRGKGNERGSAHNAIVVTTSTTVTMNVGETMTRHMAGAAWTAMFTALSSTIAARAHHRLASAAWSALRLDSYRTLVPRVKLWSTCATLATATSTRHL